MIWNTILAFILAHKESIISMSSAAVGFAIRHYLPQLLNRGKSIIENLLGKDIAKLSPEEKHAILAADKYLDSLVPAAGASKYATLTSLIVAKIPEISPIASQIAEALSDLGTVAKQILEDEQKPLA